MSRLDELMLEWEAGRDRGEAVTPESLCPDDTEMRTSLAARIALVEKFNRYFLRSEDDLPGPEPAPPAPPQQIGGFVIEGELGIGGMGVVYQGFDPVLRRRAAIKTIRPDRLTIGPAEAAARFTNEGHALASLNHDNVVRVYEGGSHDGSPYLAMEFVPGGTVGKAQGALRKKGPRAVAALVEKVARAVQAAHAQEPPIFHRDLKPSNILLTEKGEPKVADFGLAKLLDPEPPPPPPDTPAMSQKDTTEVSTQMTIGGGTPGYMAPEQSDPYLGRVSAATDVWALGVVLHELLTGRHPSADASPDPEYVRTAVTGRLGRRLAAVVERCVRRKPADRFQTAGELADALSTALARPRRRRLLIGGAVAVVLVGVAVAAVAAANVDWEGRRFTRHAVDIHKRLDRGDTVALVNEGWVRPQFRIHGDPHPLTVVQRRNDGLSVESLGHCSQVELLTVPVGTPLRIEAVVQFHRALDRRAAWGVFVDHNPDHPANRGVNHFDLAGFREPLDFPNPTEAVLAEYHIRRLAGDTPGIDRSLCPDVRSLPLPPKYDTPREVVVLLRDTVTAECGYQGVGSSRVKFHPIAPDVRERFGIEFLNQYGVPIPVRTSPTVRVGVFARHCEITVHRFTVRLILPGEE